MASPLDWRLKMNRLELDCKAIRMYPESKTLKEAITRYLAKLDSNSTEWSDWIDTYGEGKLISLYGVQI